MKILIMIAILVGFVAGCKDKKEELLPATEVKIAEAAPAPSATPSVSATPIPSK